MKFTYNWLTKPLETTSSAQEIAAKLTAIGHEVESLTDKRALYEPFIIAEVRAAQRHPNADRLKLCTVWNGKESLQVVCGAPNARAGIKVVLAKPGDYIPGLDTVLKASEIRGVESQAMMCSERELCLSDEHAGIIELPDDAPVGTAYGDYAGLNDILFDVAITPNRGDCTSVYGIARDLAAAGMGTLRPVSITPIQGMFDSPIQVAVEPGSGCTHFVGRMIRGVKNGPSPEWMQKLLMSIGLRPISALVDITNFMTHDLARPMHVYDASILTGTVRARASRQGETLEALNGKIYTLDQGMCVIADDARVLGIGGVMGGMASGCSDTTTDVFVESAWFEPNSIARTGRALELLSDARYRFERGVDPDFTEPAVDLVTKMIIDMCGGEPSHIVSAGAPVDQRRAITYDPNAALSYGGVEVSAATQKDWLEKLGARVTEKNGVFEIVTPNFRPDWHDRADCVEEIVRLAGFDRVQTAYLPPRSSDAPYRPMAVLTRAQSFAQKIKRAFAVRGYQETVTWSFISEEAAACFGEVQPALRITNPISADLVIMRPSILPNLLAAAAKNAARGFDSGALFELGPIFEGVEADQQPLSLVALRFGKTGPRHWRTAQRSVDAFDVKEDALAVLDAIGFPTATLRLQPVPASPALFHPGQSGQFVLGKDRIARFGVLHPALTETFDVKIPVAAVEIDWPNVLTLLERKKDHAARPVLTLPDLQPVTRDFAFLIGADVQAGALVAAIANADKALIESVRVFDVYQGKGVPEGQRSVAVEVTLQPREKTLTEEDLQKIMAAIETAAAKSVGAVIRS